MAKKETTVPELFPLTIDGEVQWVKRGQYAKSAAENMAIKLKADVKKAHVEEMLDAIEKGVKEPNDAVPEEMKKTFDKVLDDWNSAVDHKNEEAQEAARKKQEEEDAAREKEQAEDKLVLEVKDAPVTLADLTKTFDTGERMDRFIAKKDVDNATLLRALKAGMGMSEFSNWMMGDLVVALEDRGQIGVVAKLAEQMGKNYSNIYNAAKVCRNVPPDQRTAGVSYTIFAEVALGRYSDKKEDHESKLKELVSKASKGEIPNSQEARKLKMEASGKTPPAAKLPEEDPKHVFIVIDHTQELVEVVAGFPKELFAEGAVIINPKTNKKFQSFKAKPENRWVDLPAYKKPEPPKAGEKPASGKKNGKK